MSGGGVIFIFFDYAKTKFYRTAKNIWPFLLFHAFLQAPVEYYIRCLLHIPSCCTNECVLQSCSLCDVCYSHDESHHWASWKCAKQLLRSDSVLVSIRWFSWQPVTLIISPGRRAEWRISIYQRFCNSRPVLKRLINSVPSDTWERSGPNEKASS